MNSPAHPMPHGPPMPIQRTPVSRRDTIRGFTMIEFVMVVAISVILILGLGAIIDVPMQLVEEEFSGNPSISSADLAIATLDADIRFAVNAHCPDLTHLELDYIDGSSIAYSWGPVPGDPLVREDSSGQSEILEELKNLELSLGLTPKLVKRSLDDVIVSADRTAAAFQQFTLNPGFVWLGDPNPGHLPTVTLEEHYIHTDLWNRAGLFFEAVGISEDASAASLRVVLRRNGTRDLIANVYRADAVTREPIFSERVAVGRLHSGELPTFFQQKTIPLTSEQKMLSGECYFVSIGADSDGHCADFRYVQLSSSGAAPAANTGVYKSTNRGFDWTPEKTPVDNCQAPFAFTAVQEEAGASSDGPYAEVLIPTSVNVMMELVTGESTVILETSFLIPNKLAEVEH